MKTINVLIYGYESAPVAISITAEVTALDILTQAGLEGCVLCRTHEPQKYFHQEEAVFDELIEGETLFAVLATD